jgi:hypothetical protein
MMNLRQTKECRRNKGSGRSYRSEDGESVTHFFKFPYKISMYRAIVWKSKFSIEFNLEYGMYWFFI